MLNIQILNNLSRAAKYAQGTVINNSGDARMHIILQGEAGVIANSPGGHQLTSRLSPGDFFGDAALFLDQDISHPVIALTDIITLPISRSTANDFFRDEPALAFELCKAFCERTQNTDQSSPATEVAAAPNKPAQAGDFALFPDGHGQYTLPIDNSDREHLLERTASCPLCKQSFSFLSVRPSKLVMESTDNDMRPRYKGVEPLYYDVITCPHCLYSALADLFDSPRKINPALLDELKEIKESCGIDFTSGMNPDTIFAGYYLALMCAPHCFPKPQTVTAKLLLKLSRIYQDCGESQLEMHTAQQALDSYMYIYQNLELPPEQEQQLYMVIAELSAKLGDTRQAKDFFFKIKVNRSAAPMLRRQAENRLFEIREGEK